MKLPKLPNGDWRMSWPETIVLALVIVVIIVLTIASSVGQ